MNHFQYHNDELFCEQLAVNHLAKQFGTPAYVYSRAELTDRFLAYHNALGQHPGMICYAVKSNSNIAVLNVLAKLGSGFDIVSVGELERVLAAGGDPQKIVFSGVGKTQQEMQRALEVGVHCFNVESISELERLQQVAQSLNVRAPVSLRVNPDVDAQTHPYISTGLKENKFGIDIENSEATYLHAAGLSNINIVGVDCHIGSQLMTITPFLDALTRVLLLVDRLAELGIHLQHLDLGGGLGVCYEHETPPSIEYYLSEIKKLMGQRSLTLILEPGRSICANAGVLLTRVEYLKPTAHKNFAIVDAAMNDNIRPALYQSWQAVLPVREQSNAEPCYWDVVGPVCETGDFLAKERLLSLEQGDVLALMSSGAYGFTMSSNYNSRCRPVELMVDGDAVHVIRERETKADLMRGEKLLPET